MSASSLNPESEAHSAGARAAAWAVHIFTASGAVVGLLALVAAAAGDFRTSALWMLLALAIDGVDGTMARKARVKEVVPGIDGRRLDDIIDYLNYVMVPIAFLWWVGAVDSWIVAAAPILASGYGFSQADAKTEDHFFVGFPSYWNVVAVYVWAFDIGVGVTAAMLLLLAAAVFVPLKYVYPSRMGGLFWTTNVGAGVWTGVVAAAIAWPAALDGFHLLEFSLIYPAWYVGLSLWTGGLAHRENRRAQTNG